MKIIDAFIFYNEIELLQYRLEILYLYIDYFIIVESTHTFMGYEKKSYYLENKELFKKYEDKIIHILISDFPHKQPYVNIYNAHQWYNERYQRNEMKCGIDKLLNEEKISDKDYLIFSDVDEIVDPERIKEIKNSNHIITISKFEQDLYYYNLKTKYSEKWYRVKILTVEKFKELYKIYGNATIENIRNEIIVDDVILRGGWHLSFFGNKEFIQNKIKHFSHQELNNSIFTNEEYIQKQINDQTDLFSRNITFYKINIDENNYLPPFYKNLLNNYL